jgi:hypothetical protein
MSFDTSVDRDSLVAKAVEIMRAAKEAGDYRTAIAAIEVIARLAGLWIERREVGPPGSFRLAEERDREGGLSESSAANPLYGKPH